MNSITYDGDWLFTTRIGNPVFKKNELGVFAIIGKISDASVPENSMKVYRIGFDWIHKHKEQFKVTNQIMLGSNLPSVGNSTFKVVQQSNAEFFMFRQWIIHLTNNIQFIPESEESIIKGTCTSGIAYVVTPHTRVKFNLFSNYNISEKYNDFGFFFQVVTGFGLR